MIYIGISCGIPGSIAAIDSNRKVRLLEELQIIREDTFSHAQAIKIPWVDQSVLTKQLLEVWPGQVTIDCNDGWMVTGSRFYPGIILGSILAVVQRIGGVRRIVPRPVWQADLGVGGTRRNLSFDLARKLFPGAGLPAEISHHKHDQFHARADALLLAEHGRLAWHREHSVTSNVTPIRTSA